MPYKSKAQRRKFHAMAARGEISKAKVKEWEEKTPKKIPERVSPLKQAVRAVSKRKRASR